MSLVESWPSTEMRSKERFTHTPSSRSAVSGSSAASVCTKHSIVAKFGEIIPAPLACAVRRTVPLGSVTSTLARFGNRSVVRIASPKASAPVGRELAARGEHALDDRVGRQRHADHAGRRDRDATPGRRRPPSPRRPASSRRRRCRAARSPRWRCRSWPRPRAAPSSRQRSWHSTTGAASTPERVKRAALTVSGASETSRPRSVPPLGLRPQATPAARKPCGSVSSASVDVVGAA